DALWLVSKTVCDKLRAHLLSQGVEGIPTNNSAVFNVLQDHGIVQANADGKAVWHATVSSGSGWTHSFTFLKVAPALIWDTGARPAPFSGTIRVETTEIDAADTRTTSEPIPSRAAASSEGEDSRLTSEEAGVDSVGSVLALFEDSQSRASSTIDGKRPTDEPIAS